MSISGLQNVTASELIELDKNYLSRITLRKRVMAEHPATVLGANDAIQPAVNEFYTWLMNTYLPTRFPKLFILTTATTTGDSTNLDYEKHDALPSSSTSRVPGPHHTHLLNTANDDLYPLRPLPSTVDTLRILGGALEDDFLFLLPAPDGDGYSLQGFVTCFPSGFDTSRKFGLKLREIHAPVPGYREKLAGSMDRWFERLEVGKWVRRVNVRCFFPAYPLSLFSVGL